MGRPRTFDSDAILEKAAETFRAKGFDGTSVDDLEKATGLRRASLYGAYGDKRALYLAVLRRYDATRVVRMLESLTTAPNGRTAVERLFAVVVDEASTDCRGCLMGNAASERASHDAGVARCVSDNRKRIEGGLAAAILRGREDGTIKAKGDARTLARFLFSVILGLRGLAKAGCQRSDLREVVDQALRTLD